MSENIFNFKTESEMSENLFKKLFNESPKLAISSLKQFNGSLNSVTVLHNFVDDSHNLVFRLKINLLIKFVQTLNSFTGNLIEAKIITDLLIGFNCSFELNTKYSDFSKLFTHNIAIQLISSSSRIDWKLNYLWFLVKKPEFKIVFKELPDYWVGNAVPRLKRIDKSVEMNAENCRKFVIILLISGHFANFQDLMKCEFLEKLDSKSLKLLYFFGFNFNKVFQLNDNFSKFPKLKLFLSEVSFNEKPLKLKDQLRIYFKETKGKNFRSFAKQLYKNKSIPKYICDYLLYKEFIEF